MLVEVRAPLQSNAKKGPTQAVIFLIMRMLIEERGDRAFHVETCRGFESRIEKTCDSNGE